MGRSIASFAHTSTILLAGLTAFGAHAQGMTAGQGNAPSLNTNVTPYYAVENGAVVKRNGDRYHNRPLYAHQVQAYVLAGDQPLPGLVEDPHVYGCMLFAVERGGIAYPFHLFTSRDAQYRPGRMTWLLSDDRLEGLQLELIAVPPAEGAGMALELKVTGATPDDKLLWAFGGARTRAPESPASIAWQLDPLGYPELAARGFVPDDCRDNRVELEDGAITLYPPSSDGRFARCASNLKSTYAVANATAWTVPNGDAGDLPIGVGRAALASGTAHWFVSLNAADGPADLAAAFQQGWDRAAAIGDQIVVSTPDATLDAAASCVAAAIDGVWVPPVYRHGAMLWSVPFPGWRTLYGPTSLGWTEHVKAQAAYYLSTQVKDESYTSAKTNPSLGYGQEAPDSRFYGKGHITQDTAFYNFQSQFFDMLVHAWRWTGDGELEAMLRPALELHLGWQQDCFDPDGDGLYESYINCWPTDCVWFNGGGGPEETAYAYTGHLAAADMARRAGDTASETRHRARAEVIKEALVSQLWLPERGHLGAYRDQSGLRRVHRDAWLYGVFLPIDAGMLYPDKALQSLFYTEWGLERVPMPFGGVQCWTSNWVPSVWSVRELYPGDNYHLALAYYKAGQPDEAWELLRGSMTAHLLDGQVPGCLGTPNGGTDFSDVSSIFAKAVVEGVFGVCPDYPNGVVRVAPGFPVEWDHASMRTSEFGLSFMRRESDTAYTDAYEVTLAKPARLEFAACLSARTLENVTVDGAEVTPTLLPAVERTSVQVDVPLTNRATIVLHWRDPIAPSRIKTIDVAAGDAVRVPTGAGQLIAVHGADAALFGVEMKAGAVLGTATGIPGHHLVLAETHENGMPRFARFNVNIRKPALQTVLPRTLSTDERAACQLVDMSASFNGDIRTIYKQDYLSPRPATASVRLGSDGYSPWCFYYWNFKAPEIDLAGVPELLDGKNALVTPQHVPFHWAGGDANIAFTSRWDNWPESVTVPVDLAGKRAWFLVCGSTNPMQTQIANAVLRLTYADGGTDELELVPPDNFWTLCPLRTSDYSYERDGFCLPAEPPLTVPLGANCRAILLPHPLRDGVALSSVTLEALSEEVVIGLMGITVEP